MASTSAERNIQSTTLPNGLKIITEEMGHVRSVSVGIWIDSGSRREVGPENGISHFIEHMVFKGTATRSAEEIARSIDSLGGNLDAFTGKELVSFNTKVLDEHVPVAFEVLADMVLRPAFRPEDIDKEKGVILEELKMEADSPEYLVHEAFSSNFWKDHPLGKPILGTKDTIRGFDREMIDQFYRTVYTPSNILITAAGHLNHQEMVDLAAREFEKLAPGAARPGPENPRTHSRIVLREKSSLEQVHLILGVPAYAVAHENRFAAYIMNTLLGGSMSSRLFQNIREQRGLVYAVFSELNSYRDSGALTVYAGTSAETLREVIDLILAEFRKLREEPVPEEELRRSKNHLKGSVMLGLESTSSRMSNLARQQLYFQKFTCLDEILASIEAVTAEKIQEVACGFFRSEAVAISVLGRLNGMKLTRDDLRC
ncbi:MAG: insulinase family protein [Bryobacterales bacterium]|nr:insulinase family protein [Bryobacterales bacterium]